MASERTPLTEQPGPKYAFQSGVPRTARRSTRQFQCCICALLLALAICLLVVAVSYLENYSQENSADIEAAVQRGQEALRERDEVEKSTGTLQLASPSYRHQKSVATSSKADRLARVGYAIYHAAKQIGRTRNSNGTKPLEPMCQVQKQFEEAGWCEPRSMEECWHKRFRSLDGSCNNLVHPTNWGVAFNPFRRMVAPSYADGVGEPRVGMDGSPLPAASAVSALVHRPTYKHDPDFTVMLAVWGQFMDHDITATALSRGSNGSAIACCGERRLHPECFPVLDEQPDGSVRCTDFVRSAPAPTSAANCCLGPRNQMNQVSAYLDGSVVYGSESQLAHKLRSFHGGHLVMLTTASGRELLPVSDDPADGCNRVDMSSKGRYCFLSGDSRANENLHLTTMHLLWARQHNRIASELAVLNPQWDDERLYQEARHLVAAQIQHITYTEFLPVVINHETLEKRGLLPTTDGYFESYDASVDATIANGFAAAAFRFAHTLIPGLVRIIGNNTTTDEYIQLHRMLFDPFVLYDDELDRVLQSAMDTPIEAADPYFVDELKQHLFEREEETSSIAGLQRTHCGLDLVALNIQRGRDHGLPGYSTWRRICGLSEPRSFDDLTAYMDLDSVQSIRQLYKQVDDLDLYTGALSERPIGGGLVGATASCIIVDQFVRLKFGDRFWYEGSEQPQAFSPAQLREVRRTTLASIICDNSDGLEQVPQWAMRRVGPNNAVVSCSTASVRGPDLAHWKS